SPTCVAQKNTKTCMHTPPPPPSARLLLQCEFKDCFACACLFACGQTRVLWRLPQLQYPLRSSCTHRQHTYEPTPHPSRCSLSYSLTCACALHLSSPINYYYYYHHYLSRRLHTLYSPSLSLCSQT